jgi:hypothetical protein
MNARNITWTWMVLLAAGASSGALACGETVFRIGSGMRQHMHTAHLPARILVVTAPGDGALGGRDDLYRGLRLAGHSVQEISGAEALAKSLEGNRFDLILAQQSEVPAVVSLMEDDDATAAAQRPTVIPVVAEDQRRPDTFRISVKQDAEVGAFLRAIARAMRDAAH